LKSKKWILYGNELRYYGPGKEAFIHINIGDIELVIDENGEIVDLVIYNATKHLSQEEIEKIAEKIPLPKQKQ